MKLSEVLQSLLGCHPLHNNNLGAWEIAKTPVRGRFEAAEPRPLTFVEIPACRIMAIQNFPSSKEARECNLSQLVEVLDELHPQFIKVSLTEVLAGLNISGVAPVESSTAYVTCHVPVWRRLGLFQKIHRPSVFIAD
jgi:hypothetical protein